MTKKDFQRALKFFPKMTKEQRKEAIETARTLPTIRVTPKGKVIFPNLKSTSKKK